MTKSSTSICLLLHTVKLMVNILSIFVAFSKNINFNQIRIGSFPPTCLVHLDSVNSLRRVLFVFPYYTSTTVQCCQASGFAPSIFSSKTRGKNANQPLLLTARFGFSPLVSVNAKAHHYKALTIYIRF